MRSFPVRMQDKGTRPNFPKMASHQSNHEADRRHTSSTLTSFRNLVFKPRSTVEHEPVELMDLSHSDFQCDWHGA